MLCPKCGETYEGNACPKCEGPEIIVNNDDYLRRKKAYEEKQADRESASSDIGADGKEKRGLTDEEKAVRAVAQCFHKIRTAVKELVRGNPAKVKKTVICMLSAAVVLIFAVTALVLYARYSDRNRGQVYYVKDGSIYLIQGETQSRICDEKQAVFCCDGSQFYEYRQPEQMSGKTQLQSMASEKGNYFAAVGYDDNRRSYSLFVWNEAECAVTAEKTDCPTILCVEDDGRVIYRETVVTNDEGGNGASSLCVYEFASKSSYTVEESVRKLYIYSASDSAVYLNSDNELKVYQYGKHETRLIAENADTLYGMEGFSEQLYTDTAQAVNASADAKGVVYGVLDQYYYCPLAETQERISLGTHAGVITQIVYDKSFVYLFSLSGEIWYAAVKKGKAQDSVEIAKTGLEKKAVYLRNGKILLFTDQEGNLMRAHGKKTEPVSRKIMCASVKRVRNTATAFTYSREGNLYYRSSVNGDEILLERAAAGTDIPEVVFCKGRLYYKGNQGELLSCDTKGENLQVIEGVGGFGIVGK